MSSFDIICLGTFLVCPHKTVLLTFRIIRASVQTCTVLCVLSVNSRIFSSPVSCRPTGQFSLFLGPLALSRFWDTTWWKTTSQKPSRTSGWDRSTSALFAMSVSYLFQAWCVVIYLWEYSTYNLIVLSQFWVLPAVWSKWSGGKKKYLKWVLNVNNDDYWWWHWWSLTMVGWANCVSLKERGSISFGQNIVSTNCKMNQNLSLKVSIPS